MRRPLTLVLLATGLATAGTAVASVAGTYPGDIGTPRCKDHWYTGTDDIATFTCAQHAFRIKFAVSGQDLTRTVIGQTDVITVDADVRALPANRVLDPGVGCWSDKEHGWLAMLGKKSGYFLIAYRGSHPLATGASPAIHRLSEWNRMVLTCDARGSATKLTLRVNGKVVARATDSGHHVQLDRFGMFAAGQAGATLEVRKITGTTR